jgi:hypothetical protein
MPTRKEISKTKQDFITKKESAISADISKVSDQLLSDVLANIGGYKTTGKVNQRDLLKVLKSAFTDNFPSIMRETASAGKSLTDLNLMYFSTLLDSNRLTEVKNNVSRSVDKNLGLNPDGSLRQNGFIDKALNSEKLQQTFIKEINTALKGNPDVSVLKDRIQTFIVGNDVQNGLLQRHYNTLAKDLLITIDRTNGNLFADQLGLKDFIFGGGLIKTSRAFCLKCNGKMFNTDQAKQWKDLLGKSNGPVWDESRDGKYIPTEQMGGLGCRHVADWITYDIAQGNKTAYNAKAAERNKNFKDKNGL